MFLRSFLKASLVRASIMGTGVMRTTRAAGHNVNSSPAQLTDFLEHIRLDRRRELIGEIGDDWHWEPRHIQRGERSLLLVLLESRDWDGRVTRESSCRESIPGCTLARFARVLDSRRTGFAPIQIDRPLMP